MSELTIYQHLRSGGLSPAGACGMMGNMWAESGLKSNNVQDNCTLGDFDYTNAVNSGTITRWQFMADGFGYGLCQWTLASRKDNLYVLARQRGVSIDNEEMQCDFCIEELRAVFEELYAYLCATDDLTKAAERICAEFERPAVNNFSVRINAAQGYYNRLAGADPAGSQADAGQIEIKPVPIPEGETCQISARILRKGDKGRDVYLLQCGITAIGISCGIPDGDFGKLTEAGVKELQQGCGLEKTGIADQNVWQILFQ